MHTKLVIYLLLLEIVILTLARTSHAYLFIESICDDLQNGDQSKLDEHDQWKIICQEMYSSSENHQHARDQHDLTQQEDTSPDVISRKEGHGGRHGDNRIPKPNGGGGGGIHGNGRIRASTRSPILTTISNS